MMRPPKLQQFALPNFFFFETTAYQHPASSRRADRKTRISCFRPTQLALVRRDVLSGTACRTLLAAR